MEPTMPQTQPYTPIDLTPAQLKRQAELRAAASTPSGIMRNPISDSQLVNFAKEELASREAAKQAIEFSKEKDAQTQAELQALGLAPQQAVAIPASNQVIDESQVVSRQSPQAPTGLETGTMGAQALAGTPEYEKLIMGSIAQQQSAADKSLQATDLLMKEYELGLQKKAQNEADALQEVRKKIQETEEQAKNFQWDNRSIWEKSTTSQKIGLAIAGFLSSLSDQGSKSFQDAITSSMNRDLDQQKERYNLLKQQNKDYQSYYGDLVKKFGDEKTADYQMMNLKLGMINNKLKVMSETAQSKLVAAKALQGIDLVNSEIAKNQAAMIASMTAKKQDTVPGYVNTIQDKTERAKFQQALSGKYTLDATLGELETLVKGTGEAIPFSTKNIKAKQLVQDAQLQMKEIKKLGVLSGDDSKRLDDYISAPSLFKSDALMIEQIKGMRDLANKAIGGMEKAYGLQKQGSNIGRLK